MDIFISSVVELLQSFGFVLIYLLFGPVSCSLITNMTWSTSLRENAFALLLPPWNFNGDLNMES